MWQMGRDRREMRGFTLPKMQLSAEKVRTVSRYWEVETERGGGCTLSVSQSFFNVFTSSTVTTILHQSVFPSICVAGCTYT